MELVFKGKRTISEILSEVNCLEKDTKFIFGNSYLFNGDNLIGMLELLKSKKEFIDLVYIDPPFNTNQIFFNWRK